MIAPKESDFHSASDGFSRTSGRLALRLLLALSLVAAITFVFFRLIRVNTTTVGFFYLVAILVIATAGGLAEASVSSVVAMLCFNFFFFPPVGTFTIADPQNWVALFAFLATALTASQLSARLKRQRKRPWIGNARWSDSMLLAAPSCSQILRSLRLNRSPPNCQYVRVPGRSAL